MTYPTPAGRFSNSSNVTWTAHGTTALTNAGYLPWTEPPEPDGGVRVPRSRKPSPDSGTATLATPEPTDPPPNYKHVV